MKKNIYIDNGVKISKASLKIGDKVELTYDGLLKNSGATSLKAHIGYNEGWEEVQTIEMDSKDDTFTVSLILTNAGSLNCAFVDPAGNWDNNSGENYSFKVAKATVTKKVTTTKKAPIAKKTAKEKKPTASVRTKKTSISQVAEIKKAIKEAAPTKKTGAIKEASVNIKVAKPAKEKK